MIWSIPALQDTTIYESDLYRNTGLDAILELQKSGDSSTGDLTESRILIKFSLDELSSILSTNGITINDITAKLKLYAVQESNLPKNYTIEARAISADWQNGSGYLNFPAGELNSLDVVDGATWVAVAGSGSLTWSGSVTTGTAISYNGASTVGGGAFYTSSVASQSFSFKSDDTVNINVTDIVKNWYTGSFTNNGFLVSYKNSEITASNYPETLLQFYSSDTHTVYEPHLYISWTGSVSYSTGSLSNITYEDSPIVYVRNFRGEFLKDKKVRILLGSRPRYPRPAFAQNSVFATVKTLPSSSYYQIKDAHNDQIIIPYGEDTKISADSNGNYFDFYTTMLYPERYYKFEIKTTFSSFTEYFDSNEFTFKIIK